MKKMEFCCRHLSILYVHSVLPLYGRHTYKRYLLNAWFSCTTKSLSKRLGEAKRGEKPLFNNVYNPYVNH